MRRAWHGRPVAASDLREVVAGLDDVHLGRDGRVRAHGDSVVTDDRRQCVRPHDAVRAQPQTLLVATQAGSCLLPEVAVERSRVDAVPRHQELEDGDIPAEVTRLDRARAEQRSTQRAECETRPDGGHADRKTDLALEGMDGRRGPGAGDTVDRAEIQTVCPQCHLQSSDLRVDGGPSRCRSEQEDERNEGR